MLVGLHDVDSALGGPHPPRRVGPMQKVAGPVSSPPKMRVVSSVQSRSAGWLRSVMMATPPDSASVVVPAPDRLQDAVAPVVMNAAWPPAQRFDASCRLLPNSVGRIASRHKCLHAAEWTRRSSLSKRRRNARNCPRMAAPLVAGRRCGHLLHPAGRSRNGRRVRVPS